MKATRTCSVDGCDRKCYARSWCQKHYMRWHRYGDPLAYQRGRKVCSVEGCGEFVTGHGLCAKHYKRWKKSGDPEYAAQPLAGSAHGRWRGADAGYQAAHHRVWDQRGKAKQHACDHCEGRAAEWAYDHGDPLAKTDEAGRPYSLDVNHYIPLCRSCHRRFDNQTEVVAW